MEKKQFDKHFDELMKNVEKNIRERARFLIDKSGAIDLSGYPDDLTAPRIVMIDCLMDAAGIQKHYLSRRDLLQVLANLKHF